MIRHPMGLRHPLLYIQKRHIKCGERDPIHAGKCEIVYMRGNAKNVYICGVKTNANMQRNTKKCTRATK